MTTSTATDLGVSERFEFPVERGKIMEFARAMHSENPAFLGAGAIMPPTFLIVAGEVWGYSWERPGDSPLASMGVAPERELHLEETYRFSGTPPRAGELLVGQLRLLEPVEKVGRRSGRMSLLTTETTFWSLDGSVVATAKQVIAHLLDDQQREPEQSAPAAGVQQAPSATPVEASPAESGESLNESPLDRQYGPLTMEDVVQYQGASGDLNPHHYDPTLLASAGFPHFFSPGMLQASFLGSQVADLCGAENVRGISVRFHEIVYVGDTVNCRLTPPPVTALASQDELSEVALECTRSDGKLAVSGTAWVISDSIPG